MDYLLAENLTRVMLNAVDFNGAAPHGPGGFHAAAEIHAGLTRPGSARELDLDTQHALFKHALAELAKLTDLVNQALEVREDADGEISIILYEIPPSIAEAADTHAQA